MIVAHVADPAVTEGNLVAGAREGKRVSRSASELESASLHKSGVASLSDVVKPEPAGKKRLYAPAGPSGVKEDSARGKNSQELGRPTLVSGEPTSLRGNQ